jgi:MOSC domain-containing protein YiiM
MAILLRQSSRGPIKEVSTANAIEGSGLEGDHADEPDRGVSFLASGQWQEVTRSLGTVLLWHARRANVLVHADSLADLIGKTVQIGETVIAITKEATPCALMDEVRPGLREVLKPDCRGGVLGRVVKGGRFRVGDRLQVIEA